MHHMNKNLQSPTKLTEFAPLQPEEKQQSVAQFISKFFKLGKSSTTEQSTSSSDANADNVSQESLPSWAIEKDSSEKDAASVVYPVDVAEGRSLPNVLKRISNLLALKSNNLQAYSDLELKQYWMPDSVSKECYECCERFTTFRRRHHCRVCGQIFCSTCCNQQIPGKIFGCTGDLRVCTYCCKVVLSYLQSSDISSDLTALQENLQIKFGDSIANRSFSQNTLSPNSAISEAVEAGGTLKRKISVGYQEEKFAPGRTSYLTSEEKCKVLQNSASLRNLYEEICRPNTGIPLRTHRSRLRTYVGCFLGSELVEWLIYQQKANNRVQSCAICQALLDGGYIIYVSDPGSFIDGYALYKPGIVASPEIAPIAQNYENANQNDPVWVQCVTQGSSTTDSDNEQLSPLSGRPPERLPSSSSYTLDLNVGANTVYLSRPPPSSHSLQSIDDDISEHSKPKNHSNDTSLIRTSEQRELVPESGWHNAVHLREENGEKAAYSLLTATFAQHEMTLCKQLLSASGLSLSWMEVILPLVHEAVDTVRPDVNHDAEELDIRHYVKFKKVSGGNRSDSELVRGIVCSKNVVHKGMSVKLENAKILLLEGSIVYQRTEGRLMSLEPVLMQEQEYLTKISARIIALQPNIVLVQRNVSRLAQDLLRQQGVTLIINVKQKILESIARCSQADLVTSVDAHIGRPRLGVCKKFYLKTFGIERGGSKTLMFFESMQNAYYGGTILLRGASKLELIAVKKVASMLLFACYNWRLEKSFLMDEFADPPHSKDEFFADSKETSPTNELSFENGLKARSEQKGKSVHEERKTISESIKDFSDPLHSYRTDEVFQENTSQTLAVADLPFSNHFRKALDDTILSISPYLMFSVPYLETESGRKCKLRNFFPTQIYSSDQFADRKKKKSLKESDIGLEHGNNIKNLKPPHPFITMRICDSIDSNEIQAMLANYRACGCRLPKRPLMQVSDDVADQKNKQAYEQETLDVLDLRNHQRMAVLFCSFSHESNNAPAFCVNPWVVYMDFYGRNDIPLGCFLERYCFRTSYTCQSKCDTPMLKHIRRFVHYLGCVSISLNNLEMDTPEDNIFMWSWCSKCQSVSPRVPMSVDTWSFSFAKYLEARFHGAVYSRRGTSPCQHSLHHDHFQYFAYNNMVASFQYTSVQLWEISLPPSIIEITYLPSKQQTEMVDEIKSVAQKGHEIYSLIGEKLAQLPQDLEIAINFEQLLLKEQHVFKQRIEEIQLKLTSPTIENKEYDFKDQINADIQLAIWRISDAVVRVKRLIVDAVEQWNSKLCETVKKKDEKKKERSSYQEVESPNSLENKALLSEIPDADSHVGQKEEINVNVKKNRSLDQGDAEETIAPKCHQRSQSDGTVLNQLEDIPDSKKEDRKSVQKTILSLFSSAPFSPIAMPFSNQEHYTLPTGVYAPVVVYESEPSSIVAYALNSFEYKNFEEMIGKRAQSAEQTPSPVHKRRHLGEKERSESDLTASGGLLAFLRNKDGKVENFSSSSNIENSQVTEPPPEKQEDAKKGKTIEIQFEDANCNFFCRIFYADKFAALRKTVLPIGEEAYIRSLSRCVQWNARGGKSGSTFCKTMDDRFILKEMPRSEVQLFLESATNYFAYMQRCFTTAQPTLLGKIVGIYQIVFRNNVTNNTLRTYLLVMENLFYNRVVTQKFDLKGSMRNRLVNPDNQDGEIVLLDENLLKMSCDSPLYILPHSKAVLTVAIQNDTEFLSTQSVMDYSLLVGLDSENKELVLGIIDYIRTFTWDKKLETIVKKTGLLGGQGKLPTIMPPQEYQKRFIEAMHRYFLEVPDPWTGLGKGLE